MTRAVRWVLVSAVALSAALAAPAADETEGYVIVVPADHQGEVVSRAVLADVFLKRAERWANGDLIRPVDQSLRSEVRVAFTHDVLKMSSLAIMTYWQQQLSRGGQRPPPVKSSDAGVLEFVATTPGSIGYVTPDAPIREGVKTLRVIE